MSSAKNIKILIELAFFQSIIEDLTSETPPQKDNGISKEDVDNSTKDGDAKELVNSPTKEFDYLNNPQQNKVKEILPLLNGFSAAEIEWILIAIKREVSLYPITIPNLNVDKPTNDGDAKELPHTPVKTIGPADIAHFPQDVQENIKKHGMGQFTTNSKYIDHLQYKD